ncbi:KilA-N domain-containing protein [Pseudomonas sp. MWU349]|uniref:KilA-N domain-containing protein n=1 Tax=Pseudomonas sp. MWU349 TaxID=2802572 RepID=UPI001B340149|nr:KilA-N domain-containing protein [Pseudomonas sp. MWU349]
MTIALPIKLPDAQGNLHTFLSNNDGMYNLTDIWRELGLPKKNLPSQWDNATKRYLAQSGNFHSANTQDKNTLATEIGTIAYAMWVSPAFFELVVSVFITVRNDEKLAAATYRKLADEHQDMFAANARKVKAYARLDRTLLHWRHSCYLADINSPDLAYKYVVSKYMLWSVRYVGKITRYSLTAEGRAAGFYVVNGGNMSDGLRVTSAGRCWLMDHADEINEATRHA